MNRFRLIILFLVLSSCQQKFNKDLWNERNDIAMYPNRKLMLDDLLNSHRLKGLSYRQLVNSIGEANGIEKNIAYYQIELDYGNDIDPVYGKDLLFKLNKDSIVTSFGVKEWKH